MPLGNSISKNLFFLSTLVSHILVMSQKMQNNYWAIKLFLFQIMDIFCKLIAFYLLCFFFYFFASFLYFPFYSYQSYNYCDSNSWRSFSLLRAIVIRLKKNDFYRYLNRWKSNNYTENISTTTKRSHEYINHKIDTKMKQWG